MMHGLTNLKLASKMFEPFTIRFVFEGVYDYLVYFTLPTQYSNKD